MFNPTTVTAVIAVCAIISPILTALINNHYQLKQRALEFDKKQLEDFQQHSNFIIESYLASAGSYVYDYSSLGKYGKYYSLAFAHIPYEFHDQMKILNKKILEREFIQAKIEYEKLAIMLAKKQSEPLN